MGLNSTFLDLAKRCILKTAFPLCFLKLRRRLHAAKGTAEVFGGSVSCAWTGRSPHFPSPGLRGPSPPQPPGPGRLHQSHAAGVWPTLAGACAPHSNAQSDLHVSPSAELRTRPSVAVTHTLCPLGAGARPSALQGLLPGNLHIALRCSCKMENPDYRLFTNQKVFR